MTDLPSNFLARQLAREHKEGMAAARLEAESKNFHWDIEGWSSTDQLLLYIAGSGLHRIPVDEVVRLAHALLAEHQLHTDTWPDEAECFTCGRNDVVDIGRDDDGMVRYFCSRHVYDNDEQLTCDTCGRIGNREDGIEPGGPCQEPCEGIVRRVEE